MTSPFDFFDEIFCISAKTRPEKRLRATRQFEDLGILDRVEFLDAIMMEPYWRGCTESHRACIRKARDNGANNVLIFEEDVLFLHKDLEALREATVTLQNFDWQVFLLGGTVQEVYNHINDNLCLIRGHLTHAHAVHKSCWDEVLNYEPTDECVDGKYGVWNKSNIDLFMGKKYDKYMIKPIMAIQPDKAESILTEYYNKII
jgi:hypothetical protein